MDDSFIYLIVDYLNDHCEYVIYDYYEKKINIKLNDKDNINMHIELINQLKKDINKNYIKRIS